MSLLKSLQCGLAADGTCFIGCQYHGWIKSIAGDVACGLPASSISVTNSLVLLAPVATPRVLLPTGLYRGAKRRRTAEFSDGIQRLIEFLRLARLFDTAPWADKWFNVNHDIFIRLTASHLHLIVGEASAKNERPALLRLLSAYTKLDGCSNLVWITNRQQGKTTTVGKFIALLSVSSRVGGLLAAIYSTSLDRAVELVKAAKQYLYWYQGNGGKITFTRDCERTYVLSNGHAENEIGARPKNVDSCRGDAPAAAFFDEIAFIGEDFWFKFAYPLLQVRGRIFTCITTPPRVESFFHTFVQQVKERNKKGDRFFLLVNHSLACQECIERGEPEMCCHRLYLIPPWKSLLQFAAMKRLIPKSKKDSFAQEVFGVISENSTTYFPGHLVDAAFARRVDAADVKTVWMGVDPASHGKSELGIVAVSVTATGLHVIVGLASINVHRCEMAQLSGCIRQFVGRLRTKFPGVQLVPIIETNNNEIAATSLLRAMGHVYNPFVGANFDTYITPDVGVLTTYATKMSMIQQFYLALINGQVAMASGGVVADRTAFEERAPTADFFELGTELAAQLKRFTDRPDGTVSGKTLSGENDDMGIAVMLSVYWRVCVLSIANRV